MSNPNESREQAMARTKRKRMRIVFEIDVKEKGFDRRKFNKKVVAFFAEADGRLDGNTSLLTVAEVFKK